MVVIAAFTLFGLTAGILAGMVICAHGRGGKIDDLEMEVVRLQLENESLRGGAQ